MISEQFHQIAERHPGAVAVVDAEERITYEELVRRKTSFLAHLRSNVKLAKGDLVVVSLSNCWQFIAGFFAVAEAGAIFMPVSTRWRAVEIEWVAASLPVSAVITTQALLEPWTNKIPRDRIVVVDDARVERELERAAPAGGRQVFDDLPALYLATSGSTGRPRIVPRTHRSMVAGANNVAAKLGLSPGNRFLSVVPFYHANGFSNCMFLPLLSGASVVLMNHFTAAKLVSLVEREKIQVLIAPPFIYSKLVDHGADRTAYSSVEICLSSGAPMSSGLARDCVEKLDLRVRQLYGSSETGTIAIESGDGGEVDGSVGTPVGSVEVRVIASDGSEQARHETGEIVVRSPAVMKGYVGESEANAGIFVDGFIRTGDLGRIDEDDNLILSGRLKRVINVAGIKVDPAEIERVVESMPGVRQCLTQGFQNRKEMELIKVTVVMRPGCEVSRQEIIAHCRGRLAEHKIPRAIEFVDSIPADPAGKAPTQWKANNDDVSGS